MILACAGLALLAVLLADRARMWEDERPHVVFIPKTLDTGVEFWNVMRRAAVVAAREYGADIEIVGTERESDVEEQIRLLRSLIADRSKAPDAIILAATDYDRLVEPVREVVKAGVTLVTVDSGIREHVSASFIETDNYEAGLKAGRKMGEMLGDEATVAVISVVKGSASAIAREQGTIDGLNERSGIRILGPYYSNSSEEQAYAIVTGLLAEQSDLDGIIGLNEPTAAGAGKAIRDAGKSGEVLLIGFDNSYELIVMLDEGTVQALVVQNPFNMGYLAVRAAIDAYRGRRVDPYINTGSTLVTRDNMFTPEHEKLLFPFADGRGEADGAEEEADGGGD
jgi:ribose transport system substrate-binding protein